MLLLQIIHAQNVATCSREPGMRNATKAKVCEGLKRLPPAVSLDNNFYILASLLLSLSTCCLCGSVYTSLCTNVILLQSPTFSDVCVIQNIIDTKRNSAHYMSALEVLSQCAVFIYFLFIYLLFSVSRHSNAI